MLEPTIQQDRPIINHIHTHVHTCTHMYTPPPLKPYWIHIEVYDAVDITDNNGGFMNFIRTNGDFSHLTFHRWPTIFKIVILSIFNILYTNILIENSRNECTWPTHWRRHELAYLCDNNFVNRHGMSTKTRNKNTKRNIELFEFCLIFWSRFFRWLLIFVSWHYSGNFSCFSLKWLRMTHFNIWLNRHDMQNILLVFLFHLLVAIHWMHLHGSRRYSTKNIALFVAHYDAEAFECTTTHRSY